MVGNPTPLCNPHRQENLLAEFLILLSHALDAKFLLIKIHRMDSSLLFCVCFFRTHLI